MTDKIFGYDWSDIQRAQQGGRLSSAVNTSGATSSSFAAGDLALLQEYGIDGLISRQFYGVIDRLKGAGVI